MRQSNLLSGRNFMKNITLSVVLATLLVGCVQVPQESLSQQSKLAISSVRDIPVSYAQGSEFSLAPKYVKETSLKPAQTQAIYKLYADAIVADLEQHGFTSKPLAGEVKFHVGFGVALADDLPDETINEKFGVSPGLPESDGLEKGSFLIYIEDALTGKRVWRGAAQGFAHLDISKEERKQRAENIVASVLKQFYATN